MRSKLTLLLFAMALVAGGLTACEREGPAERVGEKIDEAVEDAGDEIEEAGEKVEDAAER